jgi:hypothetical protein
MQAIVVAGKFFWCRQWRRVYDEQFLIIDLLGDLTCCCRKS